MKHLGQYIKSIRASGKRYFTTETALAELHISRAALNCSLHRLKKKGDIVSPAKNLYLIIPPEYGKLGCLPAEEMIPILMKYWRMEYYVCLLTSAEYHGASHQKPQVFQVMTSKQLDSIQCGQIKISFIFKKSLNKLPTQDFVVKTGYLKMASPELTAMDLFLYPRHAGGLNHIATVLVELIEHINPKDLFQLAKRSKQNAWLQRLGYLLEVTETNDEGKKSQIIDLIKPLVKARKMSPIPLASELGKKGGYLNANWQIIINSNIESDL